MIILINKILWSIAVALIFLSSIYFSFLLKFPQFKLKIMIHELLKKSQYQLNSFQILMMNLAGKIGVGSIAGISLSIYIGGIGSIFWIWVITILSAVLTYIETLLGIYYCETKNNDINIGGPSFYIKKGLNSKLMGSIYAILIIFSYIGGFTGIQTNTIAKSINEYIVCPPWIMGIVLSIIVYIVIKNGVKSIAKASSKIVPIMIFIYLLFGFIIIIKNISFFPNIIVNIIKSAFNFKSFISGFLPSFIVGIQRGIFATESGLGISSIASSLSSNNSKKEGYIQILGIYITSFLVCTITSFIVLLCDYKSLILDDVNGIEIIKYAFEQQLGLIGSIIILISIILFAFSTILTGYYYGEASVDYFHLKNSKLVHKILQLITLLNLILGCILPSKFLWKIVDVFVALLSIINIISIFKLKDVIIRISNR